jgi:hypothetical protein
MTENSTAFAKPRRKRQSIGLTTLYSKRKGLLAELIFVVKATGMGFAVSKPYADTEPYDLIVEENGRLLRIQVKSVFTTARWGYCIAVARIGYHRPMVQSSAREIDFIAAYVVPHDAWYIVPVSRLEVAHKSTCIPRAQIGPAARTSTCVMLGTVDTVRRRAFPLAACELMRLCRKRC